MIKKLICLLFVLILSCCATGYQNEYGYWRKPNVFDSKTSFDSELIHRYNIDTNSIYVFNASLRFNKKYDLNSEIVSVETWEELIEKNKMRSNIYVRFLGNGKYGGGAFPINKGTIEKEDLNPKKGTSGIYFEGEEDYFFVSTLLRVNGSFVVSTRRVVIKGDSLFKMDQNRVSLYLRKKIPDSVLTLNKPDR